MEGLFEAVKAGDEGEVTRLLDADPALLEGADDEGHRPLTMAAMVGQLGVAKLLLERGSGVSASEALGKTALHWAAYKGHEELVALLLSKGAQAMSTTTSNTTSLMLACGGGHLGVAQSLLQHVGAQALQETNEKGWTALHLAADGGHEELVSFLLGQGAQANSRTIAGMKPLVLACSRGHVGVVRLFLQHVGAQALQETKEQGVTALHLGAQGGHEEVVSFLLGQGAQANSRTIAGRTPFILACMEGRVAVVHLLLKHVGAQGLEESDGQGMTALHWAAHKGSGEVVALLLGKGAQANSRDRYNRTPLMAACLKGHAGVVNVLLRYIGAQALQEADEKNRTALHWAAYGDHEDVVRLLLVASADPTIVNAGGRTPRTLAEEKGHTGCVAVFEWYVQWYECELERRAVLYRATCLHKFYATQQDMPTSQVPTTYLQARVAAGHAVPRVVMAPLAQRPAIRSVTSQAEASGKRKAEVESGDAHGAEAGEEEERHAMLQYVVSALNEELITDLLEGFPL